MHRPDSHPYSHFLGQLPWDHETPIPLNWKHQTFRGSGRSAESFSAYSWIGGWKKTALVCHRRPSCFCATAFTFLDKQKSRVTHSASGHVPPNTTQAIELKPMAISQRVSRGWFHPRTRKSFSNHQRYLAMGYVASKCNEFLTKRSVQKETYVLGILKEKFLV